MKDKLKLELIAFNIESCKIIERSGAHRVELCDNPGDGGTTPSIGFIKQARKILSKELYPIIRPRGGDFLYSSDEFEVMKADVQACKDAGCDGVVLGILKADGTVDTERCREIVSIAHPMGVTFHRAFDRVADAASALEDVISCGFERILTSGLHPTATEGADVLKNLVQQSNGRIIIMPGSGIRGANIASIAEKTGAVEFHSSARIPVNGLMDYQNPLLGESLQSTGIDEQEIINMLDALDHSFN